MHWMLVGSFQWRCVYDAVCCLLSTCSLTVYVVSA